MLNNQTEFAPENVDLQLVAQRVVKLAEIATLEHLTALLNSQADGLIALTGDLAETLAPKNRSATSH